MFAQVTLQRCVWMIGSLFVLLVEFGCTPRVSTTQAQRMIPPLPSRTATSSCTPTFPLPTSPTPPRVTPSTPAPPPQALIPTVALAEADEVLFTIPNGEPFASLSSALQPSRLGYGAETFFVGPDNSVWIADTDNSPQYLLRFSLTGDLLQVIPLENIVKELYDFAVAENAVWLADIAQPPRLLRVNMDGAVEFETEIPEEVTQFVKNGVQNVWISEFGEVYVQGTQQLYRLIDSSGNLNTQPEKALSFSNHQYQTLKIEGTLIVQVDEHKLSFPPSFYAEIEPFLGFNLDGSFAICAFQETPLGNGVAAKWLVQYYSAGGLLLGTAYRWPRFIWSDFCHDLAFGPDGSVYQMVFNPDHSVNIVRLGFETENLP